MNTTKVTLEDGWTSNEGYKLHFQADEKIVDVLNLLDLNNTHVLLDNGCGNGEFSLQAAVAYPGLKVHGFDGLESAVDEANKRASNQGLDLVQYTVSWADSLPIPDNSIDRALFRFVLHHIEKPLLPFVEMSRSMKPSSKLVLQTPFNYWEDSFSTFLRDLFLVMDQSHPRFYHTYQTVEKNLVDSGFAVVEYSTHPFPFPFISEAMKTLIVCHGYDDRLKLTKVEHELWSIELYELHLVAIKNV